jgi:hypothetical protein
LKNKVDEFQELYTLVKTDLDLAVDRLKLAVSEKKKVDEELDRARF